jgi:DNA-binding NarL/FixJ family response regulator
MDKINCIIIDDEAIVRKRMESLLTKFSGINILASIDVPEKGIEEIMNLKPDIVFLDVEMPRMNGFDIVQMIRKEKYFPTFIFVTAYPQYAIKAIKNEAFDFLLKPIDITELEQTLNRYKKKIAYLKKVDTVDVYNKLSLREFEILSMLKEGLNSKEIALKLFISKATVDTHRRNILEKTGMKSTMELITKL